MDSIHKDTIPQISRPCKANRREMLRFPRPDAGDFLRRAGPPLDKAAGIPYNQFCVRGRGGIGIRARLRGVSERVRVQVPSTAPVRRKRHIACDEFFIILSLQIPAQRTARSGLSTKGAHIGRPSKITRGHKRETCMARRI